MILSKNKRYEILISHNDVNRFKDLLYHMDEKFVSSYDSYGKKWIICYPSEEFKVIAKLSFDIEEIGTGIDIQL
jgi:hypothetical protein